MNELTEFVQSEIHEILPALNVDDYKEFKITPEETLFVYKYAETNDVAKAYQLVFGEANYTKARSSGAKMLKRKDIQDALNKMQEQIFDYALKSLPLALLQDIQQIRNLDPLDYYTATGEARLLDAIDLEKRKLIESVEHIINNKTGEIIVRYTLPSKTNTTKLMLDLLKLRDMSKGSNGDASLSDSLKTASEMRNKIFNSINMEELKK